MADLTEFADKLPPVIARSHVEEYLGGVISAGYLANLDSQGKGPERYRSGRKIFYPTLKLLQWLSDRTQKLT